MPVSVGSWPTPFSARDHAAREAREARTLRIIAISFVVPAAYVAADAARTLTGDGATAVDTAEGWLVIALAAGEKCHREL